MNRNNRHHRFADEMDTYLQQKTGEPATKAEYAPLFEVGRILAERDYSKISDKATMFRQIRNNHNQSKENSNMNKRKKWVRFSVTAASVAMAGIVSLAAVQPSSASEMMGKIMNTISLGHISVSQVEPAPKQLDAAIPEEMKQQIKAQAKDRPGKPEVLIVKDPGQLNRYTSFHVLLPAYQPSGYTFDRAEFYKDEQGTVSGSKYIDIFYTNPETGKFIFMQQRHADEETAFSQSTTHQVNRVQVNHTDAVMIGEHSIDWEAGGVLYGITAKGLLKDEILKIAESIPNS